MKKLLILLLVLSSGFSFAQKGFLGKKFTFTVGTSFAPPIANGSFERNSTDIDYYSSDHSSFQLDHEWSALPEISGEIGYTLAEKLHLTLFGSFRRLQKTKFSASNTVGDYVSNFYVQNRVTDSFQMTTNNFQLGMSFKAFQEYAPVGKYFLASVGYARTSSKVTGSVHHSSSIEYGGFVTNSSGAFEEGAYNSNHVFITLGFGKTTMIHKNLILDFGVKASFHYIDIFNFSYSPEAYGHRNNMEGLIKKIHKGNLNSSYALEFYLKFGLIY
jgi:hypothetical protein